MSAYEPHNLVESLETVGVLENDLNLFADELDERYSHAGAYSTLGCLSSMDCVCTLSTICTIFEDGETLPEVGG